MPWNGVIHQQKGDQKYKLLSGDLEDMLTSSIEDFCLLPSDRLFSSSLNVQINVLIDYSLNMRCIRKIQFCVSSFGSSSIHRCKVWGWTFSSCLGCRVVHYFLSGQVTLVAHKQSVDVLTGIAVDLLQPLLQVVERLLKKWSQQQGSHIQYTVLWPHFLSLDYSASARRKSPLLVL